MSLPQLFSLSNELLIEIISNLCPIDIYACRCTSRRLNRVIINSALIQYIMRTALSGVFDPLEPGLSLPDRLNALERWETAWMEMDLRKPNAIIDSPVLANGIPVPGQGLLSGQYFIMYNTKIYASAFYSFLDIHTRSSHTNAARWTTIEVDTPVFAFAFAPELNLAVAILEPTFIDHPKTTVTISLLQFSTGEPHPFASQPNLEVSVSGSAAHNLSNSTVIGDHILYWVGEPRASDDVPPYLQRCTSLCGIYLVAWKQGWVSELCTSLPKVYSSNLSVLSKEIILLVRRREPAIELCRLSNIDEREKASLETVRILYLPALTATTFLSRAACFNGHPGHVRSSKNHQQHPSQHPHPHLSSSPGLSIQQAEGRMDTRRHLHSVPVDDIVVIWMRPMKLSGSYCDFGLTVRHRTLLELSNAQAQAGAAETGTGTGVGTDLVVPWEKWGSNETHVLEQDPFMMGGSLAGERCAAVTGTRIKIRDYNAFRVRRVLELFGEEGSRLRVEVWSRLLRSRRYIVGASGSAMISRRSCRMLRRPCDTIGAARC